MLRDAQFLAAIGVDTAAVEITIIIKAAGDLYLAAIGPVVAFWKIE